MGTPIHPSNASSRGLGYGAKVAAALADDSPSRRLLSPQGVGVAGSIDCGSVIRVEIKVSHGLVSDSHFEAYGCPATLAAARFAAESVRGLPIHQAAMIGEVRISEALQLGPDKKMAVENATDALHRALGQAIYSRAVSNTRETNSSDESILIGMSGGVDSTVAALLLARQGCRVAGVTLSLWNEPGLSGERSCCSSDAVRRARRVAHSQGMPHFTIDASSLFYKAIVEYFVYEYANGHTPNPCAKCNARARFSLMLAVARSLGYSRVATGHYARFSAETNSLMRGFDSHKDQSYVLAEVSPEVLDSVIFPLGEMTKQQVRAIAAAEGVEGSNAKESQEICFIADDDHCRFLQGRLGPRDGSIVDRDGNRRGSHRGTYNFTVGQRKGLGIAAPQPLYVTGIDAHRSEVIIGPADDLLVSTVTIGGLTWHQAPAEDVIVLQFRSSGETVPGLLIWPDQDGSHAFGPGQQGPLEVTVQLERPAKAVACGQTGVLYYGDSVLCAGTIASATPISGADG